ncbi:HAMP domain-containing sensor histidine kinase [Phycisphaeraceae bacterium D3-23]
MTLSTRLTLKTAVLIAALLVVACVSLWGLGGLNRDLDDVLGEYDKLRATYTFATTVEQARVVLMTDPDNTNRLRPLVQRALLELAGGELALDPTLADELHGDLAQLDTAIREGTYGQPTRDELAGPLNTAINRLGAEADAIETRIAEIGAKADRRRQSVTRLLVLTAGVAALLAILVGLWQYRAVMTPLRRLSRGVDRLAKGEFDQRLRATGDREFVKLADDFNRMAEQLAGMYAGLEEKVRVRSAQLAQSERLASVGFLAAGVAHEINNPLGIIAGEAELALMALPDDADESKRQPLTAIRDEAFRCKAITQKLLSLARPGSGDKEAVDLFALAEEVAGLVRTLPQHEGREVLVTGGGGALAQSDPAQLRQVLLNLVINALEATSAGGQVELRTGRAGDRVSVAVHDDGRGMDADTLARVFEPFYTEKHSPSTPGLGLGLSISHAIVSDLGGVLSAASDGVGEGSAFTITLPGS